MIGSAPRSRPKQYSGSRAIRQKTSMRRSRATTLWPPKQERSDCTCTELGRVTRKSVRTSRRKRPQIRPAAVNASRKCAAVPMSGTATSGPRVMPVFRATRWMLKASARRS